jgi:DNA-binding XRE family transcriptional regulator
MNPASVAENKQKVHQELQRMALEELRNAKQLTQMDMAEMLDVPQSSISRIERRADMYVSTLRNYIEAMGGVLQIQAVFPDGTAAVIHSFGDYMDQAYVVEARKEGGFYRLHARPFQHQSETLFTRTFKLTALLRTLKALHVAEPQISSIRKGLDNNDVIEIGGRVSGVQRIFKFPDLIAAGFEATSEQQVSV